MKQLLKTVLDMQLDPALREELVDTNNELIELNMVSKLLNSNGGKVMIGHILEDAKGSLNWILENYKTVSHEELVSNIADLGAILRFYNTIKTASEDAADVEKMLDERLNDLIE